MNIASIVAVALISAALVVLLRKNAPEFAMPVSVVASVIILIVVIVMGNNIFISVEEIAETAGINSDYLKVLFKALGVCYITQIGKDACIDCGETALADKVDLAGKITITSLSLPLILEVLKLITELVK